MIQINPDASLSNRQSASAHRQFFAWQGWNLELPATWNPIRIEGDFKSGSLLIADLHRPRLGLRWREVSTRDDPADLVKQNLRKEVGKLAADEAVKMPPPSLRVKVAELYRETQLPGRDVWVGVTASSGRCLQIVHHVEEFDEPFEKAILPALQEDSSGSTTQWSIFDLRLKIPAGFILASHRLNTGDSWLRFENGKRGIAVRQLALARIAVQRKGLAQLLADHVRLESRHFRSSDEPKNVSIRLNAGRSALGLIKTSVRRRRYFFSRRPPEMFTAAWHDEARDRIVFCQATDQKLLEETAATVETARLA